MIKLISWNVNGLRAVLNKGFNDFFHAADADIVCLQETKMQQSQMEFTYDGYDQYWNSSVKKGYAGTAVFTKMKPRNFTCGIGMPIHDEEGRVITLEYDSFYLVNVYAPNSQRELARLDYRMQWEEDFLNYVVKLDSVKPVIICGDLNVAHNEIDIKNPKTNHFSAGFSDQERMRMTMLLESGFIDSFRHFYPDAKDAYSWWSYMYKAREKNVGWRIDYFLVSSKLKDRLIDSKILYEVMGSDHCPVELTLS